MIVFLTQCHTMNSIVLFVCNTTCLYVTVLFMTTLATVILRYLNRIMSWSWNVGITCQE